VGHGERGERENHTKEGKFLIYSKEMKEFFLILFSQEENKNKNQNKFLFQ